MKHLNTSFNRFNMSKGIAAAVLGASILFGAPVFAVNINSATVEILQNVKGIGPARAKAIVEDFQNYVLLSFIVLKNEHNA